MAIAMLIGRMIHIYISCYFFCNSNCFARASKAATIFFTTSSRKTPARRPYISLLNPKSTSKSTQQLVGDTPGLSRHLLVRCENKRLSSVRVVTAENGSSSILLVYFSVMNENPTSNSASLYFADPRSFHSMDRVTYGTNSWYRFTSAMTLNICSWLAAISFLSFHWMPEEDELVLESTKNPDDLTKEKTGDDEDDNKNVERPPTRSTRRLAFRVAMAGYGSQDDAPRTIGYGDTVLPRRGVDAVCALLVLLGERPLCVPGITFFRNPSHPFVAFTVGVDEHRRHRGRQGNVEDSGQSTVRSETTESRHDE